MHMEGPNTKDSPALFSHTSPLPDSVRTRAASETYMWQELLSFTCTRPAVVASARARKRSVLVAAWAQLNPGPFSAQVQVLQLRREHLREEREHFVFHADFLRPGQENIG